MATAAHDRDDEQWLRHVRPEGYQNPVPRGRYNLVVIGAGTAGLVAATGAAALGARVAVIEKERLGGTHLSTVVPRISLTRSARVLTTTRNAGEFAVPYTSDSKVDFPSILARARRVRAEIAMHDDVQQLAAKGVEVYFGAGQFKDGAHIAVNGQVLSFARALIATGSVPALPEIPGIETVRALRPEDVFTLNSVPRRLAIFGNDSAACEFAQAFARFGSTVTLYDPGTRLLPQEDAAAAAMLRSALERDGVTLRFGTLDLKLSPSRISGRNSEGEFADEFEEILFLSNCKPNIEGLNLDAAHVDHEDESIGVNDRLRTTNPRIFAAGDVCARLSFHNASDALARSVVANALFFGTYRYSPVHVPSLTLTDPEIARIGIGESDPHAKHYRVMELTFKDVDRAAFEHQEGFLRLYHDHRGGIHGATLVCSHAGEMIGEIALAMRHNIRLSSLAADLHPYPTFSEVFKRAGDNYRRTLLTPTISKLLTRVLGWRR
jgi:pyruvate/2-oxoglutarate dehydrogenase complex dihydrolipoamide dehydrogenase (E3) component